MKNAFPVIRSIFSLGTAAFAVLAFLLPLEAIAQTGISKMTLVSQYNKYDGQKYGGIWGWVGPGGREYALVTVQNTGGVSVVDLANPAAPREVSFIPSPNGLWHEVKSYRNYVYKVSDQGTYGIQIIDMSQLPTRATEVKKYTANGIARSHNIWIDSTRALLYAVQGGVNGIVVLSLADPVNPVLVSRLQTECHDMYSMGTRLFVSTGYTRTWSIWDMTTPASPRKVKEIAFSTVNPGLNEPAAGGYSHNIWPSADGKVLFTTEETRGTTIKSWDITDELNPKLSGTYIGIKNVIAHNVFINGKYMYVAHYGAGVRIVDVSDPKAMKEVAYHKPSNTVADFGGTWGSYQWFPSGLIIHSDDEQGMFVLDPAPEYKIVTKPSGITSGKPETRLAIAGMHGRDLRFRLPQSGSFDLTVYSQAGREVRKVRARGVQGPQILPLGSRPLPRGRYLVELEQAGGRFPGTLGIAD